VRRLASIVLLLSLTPAFHVWGQGAESPPAPPADEGRPVSWRSLAPNILSDNKQIWTFPAKLNHRRVWLPTLAIVGLTAGLVAADPHDEPYFRRTTSFGGFNHVFNGNATAIGTIVAPVSIYAAGLIRKDSKMQRTALLAGEAVVDSEIVTYVMKSATRRLRPSSIPPDGNFSDTFFDHGGSVISGRGGFPSGHTIVAFSVATVIARRYPNRRWVRYAAYAGAALVGFSRVTTSSHFVSDVFLGGALGYSIGRFAVLRQ
jgi:membrane-associated phospholipid phosphatase